MPAGFYSIDRMAFAGKLPWHGTGTYAPGLTPDAEGWATMQRLSGCAFTASLVPLKLADTGEPVPGQFAVRCDDGYLIGAPDTAAVVGPKYQLLQQERLFQIMASLGVKPHTAGTLLGRRKVWALGQLPGANETRRREGDRTISLPFVLGDNSNDGSSNITFGLTSIEVVCMNTRAIALGEMRKALTTLTARHTASAEQKLESVAEVLGLAEKAFTEDGALMQRLADTPFDTARMRTLAAQLLTGKDDAAEAREIVAKSEGRSRTLYARKGGQLVSLFSEGLGNRGNCGLDAVNAVTEYVDHARARTGTVNWDVQGASILWGAGAQLKQRAVALVTA